MNSSGQGGVEPLVRDHGGRARGWDGLLLHGRCGRERSPGAVVQEVRFGSVRTLG